MSQVKFKTTIQGKPCEVMAGWDNPLQGFFLTIFDESEDAEEECLYSGLDDPKTRMGFHPQVSYFKAILERFTAPPEGFWERCELREGNVTHVFQNGEWVSY